MSFKKIRTEPDDTVQVTPHAHVEYVEFCDVCGLEMPDGWFPRFELATQHYAFPHWDPEGLTEPCSERHSSLCSAACVSSLAMVHQVPVADRPRRNVVDGETLDEGGDA